MIKQSFLIVFFFLSPIINAQLLSYNKVANVPLKPEEKFHELSYIYYKWTENFYYADTHYRREMISTLHTYLQSTFTTPHIVCYLEKPIEENGQLYSIFRYENWLMLVVSIEEEEYLKTLASLSRTDRIFGLQLVVSGNIYKYAVSHTHNKKSVRIYLENITINYLKTEKQDIK